MSRSQSILRARAIAAGTFVGVLCLLASGCAAASFDRAAPSRTDQSSPSALPADDSEAGAGVLAPPTPQSDRCPLLGRQQAVAAGDPEQLGGMTLLTPQDTGPMPYAHGAATLDGAGVPVAYTVAANDNVESISSRFCVDEIWLHWVNAVRRNGTELYAGDVINLDAHTILSVGDQNGVVYQNALPAGFVIPPQR